MYITCIPQIQRQPPPRNSKKKKTSHIKNPKGLTRNGKPTNPLTLHSPQKVEKGRFYFAFTCFPIPDSLKMSKTPDADE
jgi:hypothetical protein